MLKQGQKEFLGEIHKGTSSKANWDSSATQPQLRHVDYRAIPHLMLTPLYTAQLCSGPVQTLVYLYFA